MLQECMHSAFCSCFHSFTLTTRLLFIYDVLNFACRRIQNMIPVLTMDCAVWQPGRYICRPYVQSLASLVAIWNVELVSSWRGFLFEPWVWLRLVFAFLQLLNSHCYWIGTVRHPMCCTAEIPFFFCGLVRASDLQRVLVKLWYWLLWSSGSVRLER